MKIKEARIAAGMTQPEVAELLGIPLNTLKNWDSGRRKPPEWAEKLIVEKLEQIEEKRGGQNMNSEKYRGLEEIKTKEDLQADAMYYSEECKRSGNSHMNWQNLYNEKFELVGQVKVKYSDAIAGLKRIVSEKNKTDMALMAYDLVDLENGFYSVNKNEDTLKALELASKSVSE